MTNRALERSGKPIVNDGSGSAFDRLFSVLADQRRRYVLYCLQEAADDTVGFDEVASKVTDWEAAPGAVPTNAHREEVEIALQHHHLPKLEARGLIDYDPRSETIRYWNDLTKQEWLEQAKAEEVDHE